MKIYNQIRLILVSLSLGHSAISHAELPKSDIPPVSIRVEKEIREKIIQSATTAQIRGLIKPLREAVLSTDVIAKVISIHVKEGDRFKQGERLIQFDCSRQRAQLKAAEAEVLAKKIVLENNQDLSKFNAVGSLELEVSKVQLDKALAELDAVRISSHLCSFKAPWNGRVTEVKANAYEVIEPGREIMKILDDKSLEIEMIVPSSWLRWIKAGIHCPMTIDETGKNYEIEISRVGARVDPVSQTVRIFASFKGDAADVLAGMSGTVTFSLPE
ncbi:MAG: HlyD family efflux transporter periplasmic adaptor subunit [Nitrosomonas sp.]|nr:MAG: HlyD family efflux transporter periplasmic adaptor subunit [Nitrosomonas sp.]